MQFLMKIFGWPFGWVMLLCYMVSGNYALALFLFTLVTRIALFPLSLKQHKEQAKMAVFKPKLDNIQQKYGNNKQKYNEEVQKLYQEEGYSPLSGCLPAIIQFPVLFGVIDVVYKPLYHILRLSTDLITQLESTAEAAGYSFSQSYASQIQLMNIVKTNPSLFSGFDADVIAKISSFNMTAFGLDLSAIPQLKFMLDGSFNWLLMIPLFCGLTSLATSFYTFKRGMGGQMGGAAAAGTSFGMMLFMIGFSVYIAFVVPAGVGLYWVFSNLLMFLQTVYLYWKHDPKKLAEKIAAEQEAAKEKRRQERIEARQKYGDDKAAGTTGAAGEKTMSQKESNRRKLAEARKRDAEKYGEEYVEVTDEDLK